MKKRFLSGYGLVSRYVLRALIGPFLFSFVTIMFVLLLQFVMRFIDQLVGKGLSAWVIIEVISLNLAWIVVLAVPMSVLVATLMAFGDLSSRNEITAMRASGMSIYRMMYPVMVAAGVLAVLLVLFYNDILPEANHRARTLASDIRRKKPTLSLVQGYFSQDIPGYSILVRKTFEQSNELEGITLYDYTNPNTNIVITAQRGRISFAADFRKLIMDLDEGEINELDLQNMASYRRVRFEHHRITMDVEGFDFERTGEGALTRGDRELSAQAMFAIIDSLRRNIDTIRVQMRTTVTSDIEQLLTGTPSSQPRGRMLQTQPSSAATPLFRARQLNALISNDITRIGFIERQIDSYMVEIQKKGSIPAAALVFVLIGVPLGIMSKRGGFGIAATFSLGFFILYWACLIGGEKLADRDILSPFWGMWSANFLIGLAGVYLMIRIGRDAIVIDPAFLRQFIPKRFRSDLPEEESSSVSSS